VRRAREAIREGLARVWDSGGRSFVTFELLRDGRPDPDLWVQWLEGELNLRWPHDEDPRTGIARRGVPLPPGALVGTHVPGANAVVHALDARIDDVAEFVDAWFQRVLDADGRYEVEARVDPHR
jgi:hypothetical protein